MKNEMEECEQKNYEWKKKHDICERENFNLKRDVVILQRKVDDQKLQIDDLKDSIKENEMRRSNQSNAEELYQRQMTRVREENLELKKQKNDIQRQLDSKLDVIIQLKDDNKALREEMDQKTNENNKIKTKLQQQVQSNANPIVDTTAKPNNMNLSPIFF